MSLLRIEQLTVRRRGRSLIDQLDLRIEPGQCWAVLGKNGSGKSTLLKTLAGIEQADSGTVLLGNDPLQTLPPRSRAQRLGLVFQHSHAGFHSTALEMALSGGYSHRNAWGYENDNEIKTALQALQAVGLAKLPDQPLDSLSGGELRRAEIARLLVQSPWLAMLDEPLNHLDIGQQISMLKLLREHFATAGRSLLLVLHDINLARRIASHLLLLKGDGQWQAGTTSELGDATTLGDLLGYPLLGSRTPQGEMLEIDYRQAGLSSPKQR